MNDGKSVVTMDQWLALAADEKSTVTESPLHHAGFDQLPTQQDQTDGVTLAEFPVTGLLTLRASGCAESLHEALLSIVDVGLPERLASLQSETVCIRWMSPDECLLSCPANQAFHIETELRKSLNGRFAIVNVTAGYTLLHLGGKHALDVLKKSTSYDVHPQNLPPGKVVNTTFAKTQVTLRCIDTMHYELLVRRSFADYVWLWLQTASAEYGLYAG